jgi:DNA-binding NarL/FixJ family response regulator
MIKILIADDHGIVRRGVHQVIATSTDITVAAEAANGAEVIDSLRQNLIDLLLLDMVMPGISGLDLIQRVRIEWPMLGVLVFSMHSEAQVVTRALNAGASGYISKNSDPELLLTGIRKIARGGRFIDPSLADTIVFKQRIGEDRPLHETLSNREFQVLQRLVTGESINNIAAALSLSAKTISTHKLRLMKKLQINSNIELMRYAIEHRLVQ